MINISYIFIPPGINAKPENDKILFHHNYKIAEFPVELPIGSTFLCDVGGFLGSGIIDHHTLDKENECATTLAYSEQDDLINKILLFPSPAYTIITHFEPDFDAIGSTYLVVKKISQEKISPLFETVANYILDVDLGKIQLDENSVVTPFSLILAIAHIISNKYELLMQNKPNEYFKSKEYSQLRQEKSKEILLRSHRLIDLILSKLDNGCGIYDVNLFDDATEFSEEIELLRNDHKKYLTDFEKSEIYSIPLINKQSHLLEPVDFIITDSPCSVLWKYWVRGDRHHTTNGFPFTCAFLDTYQQSSKNRAIIAVDGTTNFSLKGLGVALEKAELEKIIEEESKKPITDRDILTILNEENGKKIETETLYDTEHKHIIKTKKEIYKIINETPEKVMPTLGLSLGKKRKEFHRNDPWFDDRDEFTITDSPREGSILTKNEIKEIIVAHRYWQSLVKTSTDENGKIYCDINLLYPTLLIRRFYDISKFEHAHKMVDGSFITSLKNGNFIKEEFEREIKKQKSYLLSSSLSSLIEWVDTLYEFLYDISKIPIKTYYFREQLSFIFSEMLSLFKEVLVKSEIERELNVQSKILKLIYIFYTPDVMQNILQEFKILNSQDLIKYFLYATEGLDFNEVLDFSFYLVSKNDSSIFKEIIERTDSSTEQENKLLCSIFTILYYLKEISSIKYLGHTQPISSFDDWKDSIDDYLVFRFIESKENELIKEFIKKDSSFFLSLDLSINEYDKFVSDFNKIKTDLLFTDSFWKSFLNNKSIVQQKFKYDNRFNIFRKFTRTYIENASINEILPLSNLNSEFLSETEKQKIPTAFFAEINLLYSIKTFENLLIRIKMLCVINQIDKLLIDYRTNNSNISNQNKAGYSYIFITLFKKYLKLIITSQYLKDYTQYKDNNIQIVFKLNSLVHSLPRDIFSFEQISFYKRLNEILELINKRNDTSIGEFEERINSINCILGLIDSKDISTTLLGNNISLPESIIISEIFFTTKQLLTHEKNFLAFEISDNIKNENSESRNNLRKLLDSITRESTKDELRNIKQHIDNSSNEKLQIKFYNEIIHPQILFSYYLRNDSEEYAEELKRFSKDIRKVFFSIDKQNVLEIEKNIDNISRKKYSVPTKLHDDFFDIILKTQHNPDITSSIPESINVQAYEFLINHFIDKYSIDEASKRINEYSMPKYFAVFSFFTSWWFSLLLIIIVGFNLSLIVFENSKIVEVINGFTMLVLTFLPATSIVVFLSVILVRRILKKIIKKKKEKNITIYKHLSNFGINKIASLSYKLFLFEFIIPLSIGIFAAIQDDNVLYAILKIGDFRIIAILPVFIMLSYYSLFRNISNKNENIDKRSIHKNSLKIYIIIFAQAWTITVILLNIMSKYFFIQDTLETDWEKINSIGQVINFLGFDFFVFPSGTIIITLIGLFVGLFVNSFSKKSMKNN